MKQILLLRLAVLLSCPLVLFLTGCESCKPGKPGPITYFPVQVSLAPSLQGKSVLVDLVGVNEPNRPRWEAYSMSKYWKDGDPMRANAIKKTFNFTSGSALTGKLESSDPVWGQWKPQSPTCIFVLVDLPGAQADQPGSLDARRQILPLDKCYWILGAKELKDVKELKVVITESGPQATPVPPK